MVMVFALPVGRPAQRQDPASAALRSGRRIRNGGGTPSKAAALPGFACFRLPSRDTTGRGYRPTGAAEYQAAAAAICSSVRWMAILSIRCAFRVPARLPSRQSSSWVAMYQAGWPPR